MNLTVELCEKFLKIFCDKLRVCLKPQKVLKLFREIKFLKKVSLKNQSLIFLKFLNNS